MRLSDNTDALFSALTDAQKEIKNPNMTANNPFFKSKYTELHELIEQYTPILAKHGLTVRQFPCSDSTGVGVTTLITHSSGQYVESDPFMLPLAKKDPQAGGSAITYARRYALAAALCIASDPDDDGNKASASESCCVCGKEVAADFASKSKTANAGRVYCSKSCLQKDGK